METMNPVDTSAPEVSPMPRNLEAASYSGPVMCKSVEQILELLVDSSQGSVQQEAA